MEKDFFPLDNRRYNLIITHSGSELVSNLSEYATPFKEELSLFQEHDLSSVYDTLTKLIFQLNQRDIIQVQRTCFNCKYYSGDILSAVTRGEKLESTYLVGD